MFSDIFLKLQILEPNTATSFESLESNLGVKSLMVKISYAGYKSINFLALPQVIRRSKYDWLFY